MKRYISDTHLLHENILRHCARPFRDAAQMDEVLMDAMLEAESAGASLFHAGDFALKPHLAAEAYGGLQYPERHTLVAGNHDRLTSPRPEIHTAYAAFFGTTVGTENTWRTNVLHLDDRVGERAVTVLLSHAPQQHLGDADFNLFGHTHNTCSRNPDRFFSEHPWLAEDATRHFNVCVEVVGYRAVSLEELIERRRGGETLL